MQGGEDHMGPPVGLQAPLVVLLVVSLPEGPGTEEEEVGGESTGLGCTTVEDVVTEGASGAAAAVAVGTTGRSRRSPVSPAQG